MDKNTTETVEAQDASPELIIPVQQEPEPKAAPVPSPEPAPVVVAPTVPAPKKIDLSFVNLLTIGQWETALRRAETKIADLNHEPLESEYLKKTGSVHSRGSLLIIGVLLIACFAFSWFVSSGKLIVVSDGYLNILSDNPRLSPMYIDLSIVGYVLLAECGALTFMLASSMFPGELLTVQGSKRSFSYRPAVLVFRGAAISCAAIAIIANLTEMMLNWEALENIRVFAVLVTVVPPSFVLAIGYVVEKMYTQERDRRAAAKVQYDTAREFYDLYRAKPRQHPDWQKNLNTCVFEAIYAAHNKEDRAKIAAAITDFPQVKKELVAREQGFRASWDDGNGVEITTNPIPASTSISMLPQGTTQALTAGAN